MDPKFSKLGEAELSSTAIEIAEAARKEGVSLRILGAMAVYVHTFHNPKVLERYVGLKRLGEGRPMFTDLDLVGYSRQRKEVARLFEKTLGFKPDFYVNALFGERRNIYKQVEGLFDIDIFYDVLSFSHDVTFGDGPKNGRLDLDFPTISLADVVLEKLQIHQINRKDLVDLFILLSAHEVAMEPKPECIDAKYVGRVLSNDWGFEYDAMANMAKLKTFCEDLAQSGQISDEEKSAAFSRIQEIWSTIKGTPKSKEWEKRAKKGTSKAWFNEVEEVER